MSRQGKKEYFEGGKVTKENMTEFIKEMKKAGLTDEEASIMAASKIADSKPKSRMYYKIGASREMAGGKKVDPKAHMSDKLKVNLTWIFMKNEKMRCIIYRRICTML